MNAMRLNMQQTPKLFVILIFYCIMKQSEGLFFNRNNSAATQKAPFIPFIPTPRPKAIISCDCHGYFKMALCPSLKVMQKEDFTDDSPYSCHAYVNSQELFQKLCTNGTDPKIQSMEQEETHNGNEFDQCDGSNFVTEVLKRVDINHICYQQAKELCPKSRLSSAKKTSILQFIEKYLLDRLTKNPFQLNILKINHQIQVRKHLRKSELKMNQQKPEASA